MQSDAAAGHTEDEAFYRKSQEFVTTVPLQHRMIDVDDSVILAAIANLDPCSSVARAMAEIICLRERLRIRGLR